MKRQTQARIVAVAVLMALLGLGGARKAGWLSGAVTAAPSTEEAISAAIYETRNAARAGDVSRYLAGYAEPMRGALQRSLDDSGAAAFARYIRSLDDGVKGLAVRVESTAGQEAKARVEYVYAERNAVQVLYLENVKGSWRIARTGDDEPIRAAVPYGTPIGGTASSGAR
jgi:hypothetical protein